MLNMEGTRIKLIKWNREEYSWDDLRNIFRCFPRRLHVLQRRVVTRR
jgi:hypothetical protein